MTIAEMSAPDTCPFPIDASDTALDALADRAYGVLGACEGRLAKAVALVRSGAVTLVGPQHALVQSQTDPSVTYHVNGRCECADAKHAPEGRCKHRLAAALAHRLARPVTGWNPQPVPPLPEAPVSVNAYVQIAGRQVQLTVRGHDASALLAEFEALLHRFPSAAPA